MVNLTIPLVKSNLMKSFNSSKIIFVKNKMTPGDYTQNLKDILKYTIEQAFVETGEKRNVLFDRIRHLRDMINLQEMLEAGLV